MDVVKAVEVLGKGGVVIFPTDTVWGMGARVGSREGIEKLYGIKGRDKDKPTAILVANLAMARKYGVIKGKALKLAQKYWPGPLTLVVEAKETVPKIILGRQRMVGLRVPDHDGARKLISFLGEGVVTSSANLAGKVAPKRYSEINKDLLAAVDLVVVGPADAEAGGEKSSTVVRVVGDQVELLRQGPIEINN